MNKKTYYIEAYQMIVEAHVSFKKNRVLYMQNGIYILCELQDFIIKLGAKEIDKQTYRNKDSPLFHFPFTF